MLQILLSQGPSCSSKISFLGAEGSYHCPRSWQWPKTAEWKFTVRVEWQIRAQCYHQHPQTNDSRCNEMQPPLLAWSLSYQYHPPLNMTARSRHLVVAPIDSRILLYFTPISDTQYEHENYGTWTCQTNSHVDCPNMYHVSTFGTCIYIRNESSTYSVHLSTLSVHRQTSTVGQRNTFGVAVTASDCGHPMQCANILIGSPVSFNIIPSCVTSAGWYRKPKAACARSSSGLGAWWQTWRKQRRNKTAAKLDPFWFFRLGYQLPFIWDVYSKKLDPIASPHCTSV